LAPIAFRKYAELLLERERHINPVRLRGLHHAAVHEAKAWGTSMPLVITRIDKVVEQINVLAGLSADLNQKQWDAIHKTARHAIDQLRPFEQRNTPTTPDHLQIARYMEAARVTYELCEKARKIPPTPDPPIPEGENTVVWFCDGERAGLLACEPTVGPLLKLRNKAAREALLWGTLAPAIEAHIHTLWDATQALMSVAMDSGRSIQEWAAAFEDWCKAFDRLTPFSGPPPAARATEPEPAASAAASASAKTSTPAQRASTLKPTDEVLQQWEVFKARQQNYGERPLIRDFYDNVLKGRTKLNYHAVRAAIRAAQRRESRKPR
jgi:hypothetical protein